MSNNLLIEFSMQLMYLSYNVTFSLVTLWYENQTNQG